MVMVMTMVMVMMMMIRTGSYVPLGYLIGTWQYYCPLVTVVTYY